jgi:hypothetical protein
MVAENSARIELGDPLRAISLDLAPDNSPAHSPTRSPPDAEHRI